MPLTPPDEQFGEKVQHLVDLIGEPIDVEGEVERLSRLVKGQQRYRAKPYADVGGRYRKNRGPGKQQKRRSSSYAGMRRR